MKCDYGCDQDAKYQFKNGKYCCEIHALKCLANRTKMKGRTFSKNHLKKLKISRNNRKMKLWSEENKIKLSLNRQGSNNGMFGKKHSDDTKKKIGLKSIGRKHTEEFKNSLRQKMINGGHQYISSFITKISKEEKLLREMVKLLHNDCIFQFKVLRYEIDVAIPKYKIAIEYDGWYHFDTEEHKQYHKFRQEKIEKEGWKFLRYTMFDKFPDIQKLNSDIEFIKKNSGLYYV